MQKIFFVGRFNKFFEDVHGYLSKHFFIQVCVDNATIVRGMLNLDRPDLILISTIDMDESSMEALYELKENHANIPILCLENYDEPAIFSNILKEAPFQSLELPASLVKIHEKICSMLCAKQPKADAAEEEIEEVRPCVMFIDDNAFQIRVLKEILKNKYDVQLATSGMQALEIIAKRVPDIIFLDYDMPVHDGPRTLELIRMISGAEEVPVFFLTGVKAEAQKEAAMELKPAGYLIKPATAEMIHACLDEYLK